MMEWLHEFTSDDICTDWDEAMTPKDKSVEAYRRARLAHMLMTARTLIRWSGPGHLNIQHYLDDDMNVVEAIRDPPKVVVIIGGRSYWFTLRSIHNVLNLNGMVSEDALCRFISSLCSG